MDKYWVQRKRPGQSEDTSASHTEVRELAVITRNHHTDHPDSQTNRTLYLQSLSAHSNNGYITDDMESDDNQTQTQQNDNSPTTDDDEDVPCCVVFQWLGQLKEFLHQERKVIGRAMGVAVLLLYLAYTCYALSLQWGTESATRLWVLLVIVFLWLSARPRRLLLNYLQRQAADHFQHRASQLRKIARWTMYVVALLGAAVYLVVEVVIKRPENLISLAGIAILLIISLVLSSAPHLVNWHTVFLGLAIQFYLAIFMLRIQAGRELFQWLGDRIQDLLDYTDKGSQFLFGEENYLLHPIIFQLLPVILFVNTLITIAYHFGIVQAIIATFGRFLSFCLETTPVESVNAVANVFLSMAESPLFIKPFLTTATESELFAVMVGGLASIAGVVMGLIISLGIPAEHVLAASVMSAPAALAVAKVMCPEKKSHKKDTEQDVYRMDIGQSTNLLEAISQAALMGVSIVVTICANLLVFIATLALIDGTFIWFGEQAGVHGLSFTRVLSYVFYPMMYLCGVDSQDLLTMGRLVGVKTVTNVFVAYSQAAELMSNSRVFNDYLTQTNGTWHYYGDDLVLDDWDQTLVGGVLTDRSVMMSTYMLCGFCNISAMATCIGTLTALLPQRTKEIVNLAVRAGIAGNIACFLTGCVAGLVYV